MLCFYERDKEEFSYVLGAFSFFLVAAIILVFIDVGQRVKYTYLILIPSAFYLFGFVSYLLTQSLLIKTSAFKYIVAPVSLALGSSLSLALSKKIINIAIEAPASTFIHTQTIVTILLSPVVLVVAFSFCGLFFFIVFLINFSKIENFEFLNEFKTMTPIVRLIIIISISLTVLNVLNMYSKPFNKNIENIAKWSVYNLELETFSYCKKSSNEKIAYLGFKMILVGSYTGKKYSFRMEECIQNSNNRMH